MKLKPILLFLFCLSMFYNCKHETKHHVSFYHWKSQFAIDSTEADYFQKLGCNKLYLRFFDVDEENGQIVPKAKLNKLDSIQLQAEYVPVVFITNRTLRGITNQKIEELAQHINQLINEIRESNQLSSSEEIQIDCDWTETTRTAYFAFLTQLKKISGKKITCTIRMHQVKFKNKTGIPPVAKGYLMCYATSNPEEKSDRNSILDMGLLKDYLQNINDYPLPFDVALPLYSWAIASNHLGEIKLINGITEADLQLPDFAKIAENKYKVQQDCFFKGIYLNKDFTVKLEKITPALLAEARQFLNQKIKKDYDIVYYHLDELFLKRFTVKDLAMKNN